jgi:hypothetical protein
MAIAKVEIKSGGRQQHARLGSGLWQGRTRAGGERWLRHQSGNDGCGSRRWRGRMRMVAVDDNGDSGGQQQRTTKAADDSCMLDWAADYKGEGRERAANNNAIRHKANKPAGQRA